MNTGESPYSWDALQLRNDSKIAPITLPRLDMDAIDKEDRLDEEEGFPPRFGYPFTVNYTLENSGTWTETPDGGRLWKIRFVSEDALSINLAYDRFWLPEGAKMFVYATDKRQSIGAITELNNKGTRESLRGFATGLIFSKDITVEYYEPAGIGGGIISISDVVVGYRHLQFPKTQLRSLGSTDSCHVNVNCSEGDEWQQEKNAVTLILVDNHRWCSGALVNNTNNDRTPFLLTAAHCLDVGVLGGPRHDASYNSNLDNWSFYWSYEAPGCNYSSSDYYHMEQWLQIKSTTGAKVIANGTPDFGLLQLTEDPSQLTNVNLYYLGWNATSSPGTGGVGIHHPAGDLKKISTYTIKPNSTNYLDGINSSPSGGYWRISWIRTANGHSTTTGGSSGSPLINSNKLLIGVLSGGYAGCSNKTDNDWYGRFDEMWKQPSYSTDPRLSLSQWLDPLGIINEWEGGSWYGIPGGGNLYVLGMEYGFAEYSSSNTMVVEEYLVDEPANVHLSAEKKVHIKAPSAFWQGSRVHIYASAYQPIPGIAYNANSFQEENEEEENKANTSLNVIESDITAIRIYSLAGIKVYSSSKEFDLRSIPVINGVYIIEKEYSNGKSVREKLLLYR